VASRQGFLSRSAFAAACAAAAVLTAVGCTSSKPLYYWGHYEDVVYDMYVHPGEADPATQVALLSEDIQKAEASNQRVAPGIHAHLGYMYYLQGDLDAAYTQFAAERQLYPESGSFIDGMVSRMGRR
jgi:hypothetical protein